MAHQQLRQRLTRLRKELSTRLQRLQAEAAAPADGTRGFSELALQHEDEEVANGMAQSINTELRQIDLACSRLDAGIYEYCAACGKKIDVQRLQALPYATLCVTCAQQRQGV